MSYLRSLDSFKYYIAHLHGYFYLKFNYWIFVLLFFSVFTLLKDVSTSDDTRVGKDMFLQNKIPFNFSEMEDFSISKTKIEDVS